MIQSKKISQISIVLIFLLIMASIMISCLDYDNLDEAIYEDGDAVTRSGEVVVENTRSYDITFTLEGRDEEDTEGRDDEVFWWIDGSPTQTVPANGSASWTVYWEDVPLIYTEKRTERTGFILYDVWYTEGDTYYESTEFDPRESPLILKGSVVDSNGCSIPVASDAPDKSKADEFELRNITRVEINYAFEKTESGTDYCDWRGTDHLSRIGL